MLKGSWLKINNYITNFYLKKEKEKKFLKTS